MRGLLAASHAPHAALAVRTRRPGDRFHPLGAPGRRKLKSFFIDAGIPREARGDWPLVCAGNTILWVAGLRITHTARLRPGSRQLLELRYEPPSGIT